MSTSVEITAIICITVVILFSILVNGATKRK